MIDILSLLQQKGITAKKVSGTHGGEYHSSCPGCGGNDRFHVWPDRENHWNNGQGLYWCRGCGESGDAVQFLIDFDDMDFKSACAALSIEVKQQHRENFYKKNRQQTPEFTPEKSALPAQLWQEKATNLVTWAHDQLLKSKNRLDWLQKKRGLDLETIKEFKIGFNPGEKGKDLYRTRESWGLEPAYKDDKKTLKRLWIPSGIVIPLFFGGNVLRIRIRTDMENVRYYVMPGSGMRCMLLGDNCRAYVIVESEIDAVLVYQETRQNGIGALAIGSASRKPDLETYEIIKKAPIIINALDYDQAGRNAGNWWKENLSQVERFPVPIGKDPGDAFEKGLNIGEWVRAGLPSAWLWKAKENVSREKLISSSETRSDHFVEVNKMV